MNVVAAMAGGLLVFWSGHKADWLGLAIRVAVLLPQVVPALRQRLAAGAA